MIKKIFSTFTVRFIAAMLNFLIAVIISRYLGASGKGEQGILIATITIIILFDNLVGGATVVYLTPRLKIKNILTAAYLWAFFVSIITFLILFITGIVDTKYQFWIALLSGIFSFSSINTSILIGKEKISQSNILVFMIPLLTFLLLLLFYGSGIYVSIQSYIIALFLTYSINIVISFYFLSPYLKNQQPLKYRHIFPTLKIMLSYGYQNQLAHIFQLSSYRISFFVIEYYWGKSHVGVYSNGVSIIESVWMIASSINLYQYSRIVNTSDTLYQIKLTESLTKYGLLIALMVLLPLLLLPSSFYIWVFGKEFSEISNLILFLAPGIWVYNYSLLISHYFSGNGKYYINAICSGAGLLVTLAVVFILVPKYGIYGAAITSSISYFFTALMAILFFKKEGGSWVIFPTFSELKEFSQTILKNKKSI